MTMAKRRPRSLPISSRMKGNFWIVEMMIFLPLSMNPRRSACPTVADTCEYCLIVSRIWRSVTTMIESLGAVPSQPDQLVGQPGDGVALAAAGGTQPSWTGTRMASLSLTSS